MKKAIGILFITLTAVVHSFALNAGIPVDSIKHEIKRSTDTQKIQLIEELVWDYLSLNMDSANAWAEEAVAMTEKWNSYKYRAKAYNLVGIVRYKRGYFNKAITHYVKALEFNKKIDDRQQLASNYNNLGLAYYQVGNYDDALDYQLNSLAIKESLNDSLKLSNAYNNIGMIYDALGDYENALKNYRKCLKLDKKYDNYGSIGLVYNNIGIIHHKMEAYEKAKLCYEKAVAVNDSIGQVSNNANVYNNIGITHSEQGKLDRGEKYFRKSLSIGKQVNKPKSILESYYNLGKTYYRKDQADSALFYLQKAENIALDLGMKPMLTKVYRLFSKCYEKLGELEKALAHYKNYASWKDSVWNKQNQKALQKARAKFESREKKKEIELLQKQDELQKAKIEKQDAIIYSCIAIVVILVVLSSLLTRTHLKRKKAYQKLEQQEQNLAEKQNAIETRNEELKNMNEEKNHFIRILAHDLRTPLNQIHGLADLILAEDENLTSEQQEHLGYIKEASTHASNMISKLLDINKIENLEIQPEFKEVDLGELLRKLSNQYEQKAREKSIELKLEVGEAPVNVYTDPYYCRQVLDNLINNALKYSPHESHVWIRNYEDPDYITIEVQDEGPGLSKEDQEKLFEKFQKLSNQPSGNEPSTGLGLSIVKKYVKVLSGQVWCESEPDEGTSFFVKFPKVSDLVKETPNPVNTSKTSKA